jgi:hypothetical protein
MAFPFGGLLCDHLRRRLLSSGWLLTNDRGTVNNRLGAAHQLIDPLPDVGVSASISIALHARTGARGVDAARSLGGEAFDRIGSVTGKLSNAVADRTRRRLGDEEDADGAG